MGQTVTNPKEKKKRKSLLFCQASEASLVVDFKDWQLPLGRRFRSLKLWMVMRLYGAEGIRAYLRNHIQLAKEFEELVRADERYEVRRPPAVQQGSQSAPNHPNQLPISSQLAPNQLPISFQSAPNQLPISSELADY